MKEGSNQAFASILSGLLQLIQTSKGVTSTGRSMSQPSTKKVDNPRLLEDPEVPKGQSYYSYLSQLYFQSKVELPVYQNDDRPAYRLAQDIYLLLELSNHATLSVRVFQEIHNKKVIHRTVESMRSRFNQYIRWLEEKDIRRIIQWIKIEGIHGYMYFEEGPGGHKKFTDIRHEDMKETRKRASKRDRPLQDEPLNLSESALSLERQIRNYAKIANAPTIYLLEKLDQLSGDLNDLEEYIETRNQTLLWSVEEDMSLKDGDSLALKYKGAQRVEKRKQYLKI